ncbi:MAG TPA: DUF2293 domain-containing protein [Chloroflexota bacterium]|nr:DUF2293 domain-containing protein [Chloroflexota bacterium]
MRAGVAGIQSPSRLERRVVTAAEATLTRNKSISPIDVFAGIGWLPQSLVDEWRQGRIECLEHVLPVRPDKLAAALEHLHRWAARKELTPSEVAYVAATRDRRPLRFTAAGDQAAERAWRTHWVRSDLSEAARQRLTERQSKAPDLVVIEPINEWACSGCGGSGSLLFMEDGEPLCLGCADMDHLVFLPAGNAALSRRAKKASRLCAVVVRFSRARKRYERQGILVEEVALEQAEEQCLADEEARGRRRERDRERRADQDLEFQARLGEAIVRLFPGCPPGRAEAIALHAGTRGSGRVGRSAAGRALDEEAVRLAVVASIRHQDTDYDALLMSGVPRADARDQVRPDIDRVLAAWQRP